MPISSPPQTLPTLPVRNDLNVMVNALDFWGHLGTDGPFYYSSGGSETFQGDSTYPITLGLPTSGTVPAINYSSAPLVLSWFDYFAVEFQFFVPDFGQAGASVFGIGLTSGAGSPCTTNVSTAQLRFGRNGTSCSGAVAAGVFNVLNGPVSNVLSINTTTAFSVNTWYRAKIEYNKSPKTMMYYVNDAEIISDASIPPTNIPDAASLTFRMHGSLTIDPSPVTMQVQWVKFTGELSSYSREP